MMTLAAPSKRALIKPSLFLARTIFTQLCHEDHENSDDDDDYNFHDDDDEMELFSGWAQVDCQKGKILKKGNDLKKCKL